MRSTFRLASLLAVIVAMLALSAPAMAKGGGGGGGGTCATIDSLTFSDTNPIYGQSLDAVVTNRCVDERRGSVNFDYYDLATGAWEGASVYGGVLGTYTFSVPAHPSTTPTTIIKVSVYSANGKLQDTKSVTV